MLECDTLATFSLEECAPIAICVNRARVNMMNLESLRCCCFEHIIEVLILVGLLTTIIYKVLAKILIKNTTNHR